MIRIRPLPEFTRWLGRMRDPAVRGVVLARLKRLECGLPGDIAPVGGGVLELRIHVGAGWRIYYTHRGQDVVVLLLGGTKRTQTADISAQRRWLHCLIKEYEMSKRIKADDLPEFDPTVYLDSEEAIAAYLTDVLAAGDAGLLAAALGDIARARGMTQIAESSGMTREALYKALRPDSAPRFDTVSRVCAALGVRLVALPVHA
jgi:probable addiction module antidote protein/putative addiction module killer protein